MDTGFIEIQSDLDKVYNSKTFYETYVYYSKHFKCVHVKIWRQTWKIIFLKGILKSCD